VEQEDKWRLFSFINDIWDVIFKDEWKDQISARQGARVEKLGNRPLL
jgi:hypothetical protein